MERLQLARRRREEAEAAAKEEEEETKRVEEAMKAAAAAAGDADEDDDGIEKLDPREIKKMNPKQVGPHCEPCAYIMGVPLSQTVSCFFHWTNPICSLRYSLPNLDVRCAWDRS